MVVISLQLTVSTMRFLLRPQLHQRGSLANMTQRRKANQLVDELVLKSSCEYEPILPSAHAPVTGRFRLLYGSTKEPFRSSIFFWAFKQFFSGNERTAEAIFRVTGSLPGVHVYSAEQVITETEFRSEVDLEIWPGFRGLVVSTGRLLKPLCYDCGAEEQVVKVRTTRVLESNYLPVPGVWAVDVGNLFETLGGPGKDSAKFRIPHGDEFGHVLRMDGGSEGNLDTFVYKRVSDAESRNDTL